MNIIGISYSMHESAACLIRDGKLVFACAEERLSKVKQDASFPYLAIQAALDYAGLSANQIDHVALGWDSPGGSTRHDLRLMAKGRMFRSRERLEHSLFGYMKTRRHGGGKRDYLKRFGAPKGEWHFINHHLAHATSAWVPSGFSEAGVLVIDGRGAREATTFWHARDGRLEPLETIEYPDSLGVFYAGITRMLGFQPLSDEWKVMGLASYGESKFDLSRLIEIGQDRVRVEGKAILGRNNSDTSSLEAVVGKPRRDEQLNQTHKDLARSAQDACEHAMLAMLRRLTSRTGSRNLCMAGGVALNCKANGELLRSGLIDQIYVQPAAGDDGACIGAAYAVYQKLGQPLPSAPVGHSYLGTRHSTEEIESVLQTYKLPYRRVDNAAHYAAERLAEGKLIGWFQGRMEFGPRALGNRSILSDPRNPSNRDRVNEAVKFRESWRPFAPSVLEEKAHLYFKDFKPSPYMILSFWATDEGRKSIPAVVHVDGSCRVQSVTQESNARYYELIRRFGELTGVFAVMNTSFNLKGDAIVESPKDAVQTFFTSGLDELVIDDFAVSKGQLSHADR